MNALEIQLFLGLYFIGLNLSTVLAKHEAGQPRRPIASFAQFLFGLLLLFLAMIGFSLIGTFVLGAR